MNGLAQEVLLFLSHWKLLINLQDFFFFGGGGDTLQYLMCQMHKQTCLAIFLFFSSHSEVVAKPAGTSKENWEIL